MIDCGWADYNGRLEFHSGRFPDPRGMMEALHGMGFRVMLWECPFITADSEEYRQLAARGYLVRQPDGEPAIKHWWDGYSAVLDMTHPGARDWLRAKNAALMERYGVDGFKMDAGDARYYSETDVTFAPVTPNGQCELWARFGLTYAYNEYRACFGCSGESLVQRLADKCHSWDESGLGALVPHMLAQSALGYPFGCPDMIGGGEYLNFLQNSYSLDEELVVRYAQCSALMPMMQFSAAPWRILSEENFRLCREAAQLHVRYGGEIYRLAQAYRETGGADRPLYGIRLSPSGAGGRHRSVHAGRGRPGGPGAGEGRTGETGRVSRGRLAGRGRDARHGPLRADGGGGA